MIRACFKKEMDKGSQTFKEDKRKREQRKKMTEIQ